MAELEKQRSVNSFLNFTELNELKRLLADMEKPAKEITSDKYLLGLFTIQFALRMNNHKKYNTKKIVTVLEDLSG